MAEGIIENRWACPDLGEPRPDGYLNAIPSSKEESPDCWGYYLRMQVPGPGSLGRRIQTSTADHLIGSIEHPGLRVLPVVQDLKAGAIRSSELSPKMLTAVRLAMLEQSLLEEHLLEEQRRERERAR